MARGSVFTDAGVQEIIEWMAGESATAPTHMGVGTDTTSPSNADTTLGSELSRELVGVTSNGTSSVTFSFVLGSGQQNSNTLTEVGLFNASTSGDMFARFTHANIAKTSSIEVEYEIILRIVN